jgi:Dyp-type peroxidase family
VKVFLDQGSDLMPTPLALDNIQGNIVGGFNKDFQSFLFLQFKTAPAARSWIAEISDENSDVSVANSSSADVLKFNAQFKAVKADGRKPELYVQAEWTNLAISFQGLKALNVSAGDLAVFPHEFAAGMTARKTELGDVGPSDPANWMAPFGSTSVHAVLTIAADDETKLIARTRAIVSTAKFSAGAAILLIVEGRTRLDVPGEAGHEHFGFKDGVSQPGLRGVDVPDDPIGDSDQGHPGQDLLWPGEFVLGYPTQIPKVNASGASPNPDPGPISTSGPSWTKDGSYLVFRRLAQDVPAFHQQVASIAASTHLTSDLVGAKLVGRYKSGCPLEKREFQPPGTWPQSKDPGIARPELGASNTLNNNFEFGDDPVGAVCPLASHIRKAYPRDEISPVANPEDSESDTQTHRLLRRGIPFGASFGAAHGGQAEDPRGLVFQCFQKSIASQFEFVQKQWVNSTSFPPAPAGVVPGEDPIIAQSQSGTFQIDPSKANISVAHFVKTTGGEYFFAPSISALQLLGRP